MATATKATTATSKTLTCPECGKTFTRAAALGAHRKMTHGVAGSSKNATSNRARPTRAKRQTETTPARSRSGPRASTAGNVNTAAVDRDALLRTLFPSGIPPRQETIGAVNNWLDEAERIARSR